ILDVGCGGGATIKDLLKLSEESIIYGLDYAQKSIEISSLNNKEELNKRVFLKEGDVAQLPYEDNKIDLVTAVETVYFWPDITKGLEEIHRVLKTGGQINILCEAIDWPKIDGFFKIYRPSELQELLLEAHFKDVAVHHGQGQYISVVGVK
ncbi:class I SAM-dependent methyltransferase, partial [Sharpea azabuensis]|uniref:class I SAM-dependent methyltransferase n=1 Tax=Sharpea azabuensis TaxID=322505 RepID=UPI0013D9FE38